MSGKKITGRTKQLSLKATPEFHQRLKELSTKEKCLMIEVLEQAMELYERKRINTGSHHYSLVCRSSNRYHSCLLFCLVLGEECRLVGGPYY